MIKILYVHGYNGKPNGGSFQKLSKYAGSVHFNGEEVEKHPGWTSHQRGGCREDYDGDRSDVD